MVGGFALVANPAKYGASGIMTFIVNNGIQKSGFGMPLPGPWSVHPISPSRRCDMKKVLTYAAVAVTIVFLFAASGRAETTNEAAAPAPSLVRPEIIYITDFQIETGDVVQRTGPLQRLRRLQEDPAVKASRMVELLASSLTRELQNNSIPARRLYPGQSIPRRGWLVKGEFLEVDQGNRLRRAVIGFGAGASDMQVEVEVIDLSSGSSDPFIVFGTGSGSGRAPGAIISHNPYVAAAKFVLSKRASERDIRKTARRIADVLTEYIQEGGGGSN